VRPYPLMMNLEGRQVIVVGGGRVAARKIVGLLESGALVVVISPKLEPDLENLRKDGRIEWASDTFDESVLDRYPKAVLLFGTTDQRDVNLRVFAAAMERGILCNIADVPDLCTFIVPAVISQGDLLIAVSTGGSSPALARRIREDLEKRFGPEYAAMTRLMAEIRKQVLRTGSASDENKKLFLEIVDSELLGALRENDKERAVAILRAILPTDLDPARAIEEPPCA
jgi:precorrin-2 dehydrogenase/sirohydrochlorin ferrochelatase